MRCFENIAKLIREKRLSHPRRYSQSELSHLLGYKNGQFISNVERALCSIPLKMLKRVSEVLNIPTEVLKAVMLRDNEMTLNSHLAIENNASIVPFPNKQADDSQSAVVQPITQNNEYEEGKLKIAAEG